MLKINLANIAKKLKSGKTLTIAERNLIESAASATRGDKPDERSRAKSYVQLAEILGVTRQAIYKWKKIDDAPKAESNGDHIVSKWRQFIERHGFKGSEQKPAEDEGGLDERNTLQARKLLADVETREHKLKVMRGEVIPGHLVREFYASKVGEATTLLRNKLEDELPPILAAMDDAAEIKEYLCRLVDEFTRTMKRGDL